MKHVVFLFSTAVILFVVFLKPAAWGQDAWMREFRLYGVKFVGIRSVSEEELSKTLSARPSPQWKFWGPKTVLTFGDLEEDLLRIKQFYQAYGYYHAQATYQIEEINGKDLRFESDRLDGKSREQSGKNAKEAPEEKPSDRIPRLNVTFAITEGPPIRVHSLSLTVEPEPDEVSQKDLLELLPLKTGQIFEMEKYRQTKEFILKVLGNKGYPLAELSGRVVVNTVENQARVTLELSPGEKCKFGPLILSGTDDFVKDVVIQRAMSFKEGEPYVADKVDQSQRNLFDLDIFRTASVQRGEPEQGSEAVPMSVQVKPKERQSVKAGVGYGNEDGFRVRGAWTYRNVLGWGGKISLSAKRSDLVRNVQADYVQPYFLDAKNTLKSKAGFEQEILDSYTNRKVFSQVSLDRNFRRNWTWAVGYKLEGNYPEKVKVTNPETLKQITAENNYFISSMEWGMVRDTTDNPLDTKKGSVASVSMEQASSILGSEINYFMPTAELKKYQSLSKRVVLAGRVRFQTIQKTEDTEEIPIFKRLSLGGSSTVRGYGYQKLGPLDTNGNPLFGMTSFNGNLELRYPIYKKISGVVFLDMGLLDEGAFRYDAGEMRYAAGVGVRYNTLIGPVRVDFGYKLNPPTMGDVAVTNDPGRQIEDRWKIHFSIGQIF